MSTALFPLLGTLFLISGSLLLGAGVLTWLRLQRKYSTWSSTTGIVIRVVSHTISAANFHFYPVVEFKTKTGAIVQFESGLGFHPARHKPGQKVSVWYDEGHPEQAALDLMTAKWTPPLALGGFGLVFLALGGIIASLV